MAKNDQTTPETIDETQEQLAGKGRATPSRKDQQAARRQPLVPTDRKEAKRKAREQMSTQRQKAQVGLAAGDERYLPIRDKGPQKKWIRDYVDARWNLGEFMIPGLFVIIALSLVPQAAYWSTFVVYGFVLVVVVDCLLLSRSVKKKLEQKFGAERVERGVRWYAAMRALQMRRLRLPKPQVKRGEYPAL